MNIAVFVPTAREAAHISLVADSLEALSVGSVPVGRHDVTLHICGVGLAECAAETVGVLAESLAVTSCGGIAAAHSANSLAGCKPDLAILAGIAGVVDGSGACAGFGVGADSGSGAKCGGLSVGESVIVVSEVVADMGRLAGSKFTPLFRKVYPATAAIPPGFKTAGGHSVSTAGWTALYPLEAPVVPGYPPLPAVENMEGAAFFAVCARFGVPAMELRTVSNSVGEPISPSNLEISTKNLALALEKLLESL